jgi:Uma2 family endonuclease
VVKESPEFYRSSKAIIKNPFMVVEVLSDSTANYDWKVKLMRYQNMESMQQIVFIDPDDVCVTVSSRSTEPNVWTMITYYNPTDMVTIDGHTFPLSHFFEGMPTFQ